MRSGDEALHPISQLHHHTLVLEPNDASVHFVALRKPRHQFRPRIVVQLLDPQRDPLVVRVHVEDHDFDLHALLHHLGRMFHATGPAHVRYVDEAVDARLDFDEGTEGGQVAHGPGEARSGGILQGQREPGILLDLLHAEGDLLVVRVDLQDHGFDFVADRHDLGRVTNVAGPRHLGDVDESLDPLLQLHEGAVVGDRHDLAAHPRTDRIAVPDVRPRVGQQLLQTEGDAFPVPVDVQHLDVDPAPDRDHLRRVADTAPGHVGDVQQSVQAAQIDEGAEVRDVLYDAFANLSHEKLLHQSGALLLSVAFEDHPARHDNVAAALVEFDDHELVALADQVLDVGDPSERDLRTREEGVDAHDVDSHATLDLAGE